MTMSIINSEMFEFRQEQMQAMFLSKLIPVLIDIQRTKPGSKKSFFCGFVFDPLKIKTEWLQLWWGGLQGLIPEECRMSLPSSVEAVEVLLGKISLNQSQKRLVLIDCVEFEGYYARMEGKRAPVHSRVKMEGDCRLAGERIVARVLGIPDPVLSKLRKTIEAAKLSYRETMKRILRVIGAGLIMIPITIVVVPILGAIIGTAVLGLHGAAAVSAGLAWVGFGSLASGGFGMAGGTAILAGAGAIIGLASGGLASKMLHIDKASAIRNAIQLEMLICVFILAEEDGRVLANQLYDEARNTYQKVFCLRDDVCLNRENKDVLEIIDQAKDKDGAKFDEKQVRAVLVKGLSESLAVYGKMLDRIRKRLTQQTERMRG